MNIRKKLAREMFQAGLEAEKNWDPSKHTEDVTVLYAAFVWFGDVAGRMEQLSGIFSSLQKAQVSLAIDIGKDPSILRWEKILGDWVCTSVDDTWFTSLPDENNKYWQRVLGLLIQEYILDDMSTEAAWPIVKS